MPKTQVQYHVYPGERYSFLMIQRQGQVKTLCIGDLASLTEIATELCTHTEHSTCTFWWWSTRQSADFQYRHSKQHCTQTAQYLVSKML